MFAFKAKIYEVIYNQSINPALSHLMKHLVIGQRQKAPNFSDFHWSSHDTLVSIGKHFVTTRVVHLPKRTETSLITESDLITSYCCYARLAQPGPNLCVPCMAAIASFPCKHVLVKVKLPSVALYCLLTVFIRVF